jgi:hypothetical protein
MVSSGVEDAGGAQSRCMLPFFISYKQALYYFGVVSMIVMWSRKRAHQLCVLIWNNWASHVLDMDI